MYSKVYVKHLLTWIGELLIGNEHLVDSASKHKQWLDKAKLKLKRDTRESFDDVFNDAAVSYLIVHNQQWPEVMIGVTLVAIRPLMTTDLSSHCKIKYAIHNSVYAIQLDMVVRIDEITAINFDYASMTNVSMFTSFNSILSKFD